jgi:8-oxo-dGTP diphosphatase
LADLPVKIRRAIAGVWQWYLLWLLHDKFMIGVSGVVLNERNQILLLKHRYWPEGSWGLPGGYAKKGERLEDTLAREVKEETGYTIEVLSLLKLASGYKLRLEVHYLARMVGGDLQLDEREVLEAKFFSPDELPIGLLAPNHEIISLALAQEDGSP